MRLDSGMRTIRLSNELWSKNGSRRLASIVRGLLIILIWSTTAHSEQAQREPDDAVRFQAIYDMMQRDQSPDTFKQAYALVSDFKQAYPTSPYPLLALGEIKYCEAVCLGIAGALEEATALSMQAIKLDARVAAARS